MVSKFARHYKTGEPLPADRLAAVCAAKHTFAAAEMQQQVFYSALDQKLHATSYDNSNQPTSDILKETQCDYYGLPFVPNTVTAFSTDCKTLVRWRLFPPGLAA